MPVEIEHAPGSCRRCKGPMIRRVTVVPAWGGDEIRKPSAPYCGSSCTRQQLDAWDREHGESEA
ncbi:hypothetical protein [Streptomyces sp. NPDC055210]